MDTSTLIKVGGIGAFAVALTQGVGNGMHPPIPGDTVAALGVINGTGPWVPVHIIITVSYFLFVPFVIGAYAAFRNKGAAVRIATPLVILGAGIGAAQITTHLTVFHHLAGIYATSSDPAMRATAVNLFEIFWPYSVALEISHLIAIFVGVLLFGLGMLQEVQFPRWVGWLGVVAGGLAVGAILIGKFIVTGRTGDLVFAGSLLPLIVWIIAVGVVLVRMPPAPAAT